MVKETNFFMIETDDDFKDIDELSTLLDEKGI